MMGELVFYTTPSCQLCKPFKKKIAEGEYAINIRVCDDIVEMSENLVRSVPALKTFEGGLIVGAKAVDEYLKEFEVER